MYIKGTPLTTHTREDRELFPTGITHIAYPVKLIEINNVIKEGYGTPFIIFIYDQFDNLEYNIRCYIENDKIICTIKKAVYNLSAKPAENTYEFNDLFNTDIFYDIQYFKVDVWILEAIIYQRCLYYGSDVSLSRIFVLNTIYKDAQEFKLIINSDGKWSHREIARHVDYLKHNINIVANEKMMVEMSDLLTNDDYEYNKLLERLLNDFGNIEFVESKVFVSAQDKDFSVFYRELFLEYEINSEGLIVLTQRIYMSPEVFIYWILTTDDINGVQIGTTKMVIENDIIYIQNNDVIFSQRCDISEQYNAYQQLEKIRDCIGSYYKHNSFYPFITNIVSPSTYTQLHDLICNYFDDHCENNMIEPIIYKFEDEIVQIIGIPIVFETEFYELITQFEVALNELFAYYKENIFKNNNVAVVNSGNVKIVVDDSEVTILIQIAVIPIDIYNQTIEYNLGLLEGYLGEGQKMGNIKEWIARRFDIIASEIDDNLYHLLYNRIIDEIFEK